MQAARLLPRGLMPIGLMMRTAHARAASASDNSRDARHAGEFQHARVLWQYNELDAADQLLCRILDEQPAHVDAANFRAKLLQSQGRLDAAGATLEKLCSHASLDAAATLRCVQFVRQCQRQGLAARLCEQAFARGIRSADLHALSGLVYRELGQFAEARDQFDQALRAGVDLNAWFVLGARTATQRYRDASHPDFERLHAHFHDANYPARARAASGFGLAKAYDDIGDYARATATLRSANACARIAQPWRREDWVGRVDACVERERARARGAPIAVTTNGLAPIFVVGLPRSGTTLAAMQLARHADIRVRGELPHIPFIAARLAALGRTADAAALEEAASLYAAHIVQDDAPARSYVDCNQMNFRHLDLIAQLFPHARIVHCVRERRDVALSQWSQFFAHDDCAFANDFADIAAFCDGHDRLMRHWSRHLDLPTHTVVYEDLIADPARIRAGLEQFVGARACAPEADPEPSKISITSSSLWQARQPIHASSMGRWKKYAPYLPELAALS